MNTRRLLHAASWLAVVVASSATLSAQVTNTSMPNVSVLPDNGCIDDTTGAGGGGITDTIAFTQTGTINDVNVEVAFTTTWRGDIQAALSYSGGGGNVVLINNHGTSADNYYATLDSDAAGPCFDTTTYCGAPGNCASDPGPTCQPNQSLDAFDTLATPGTFTLATCDRAASDTVTLVEWSVTLDGPGLPVELTTFTIE